MTVGYPAAVPSYGAAAMAAPSGPGLAIHALVVEVGHYSKMTTPLLGPAVRSAMAMAEWLVSRYSNPAMGRPLVARDLDKRPTLNARSWPVFRAAAQLKSR